MNRYKLFLWVLGLQAFAAAVYLALIPGDPKNSFMFGLSVVRVLNIALFLIIGLGVVRAAVRDRKYADLLERVVDHVAYRQVVVWLSSLLFFILLLTSPTITEFIKLNRDLWGRMLPSVLLICLTVIELNVLVILRNRMDILREDRDQYKKLFIKIFLGLLFFVLAFVIVSATTGFGIIPPIKRYWNTAGVPILYSQILYLIIGYIFFVGLKDIIFPRITKFYYPIFVILVLWTVTFIIWDQQPISKSPFVFLPESPNFEVYPESDARRFDLGARFMLEGQGIFNGESEEKPFQMAYLALLHSLVGNDYVDLVRAQVAVLSLTVPFLYLIGRKLYSEEFGLALAAAGTMYEVNTFDASVAINSAHMKLLLSEPLTLLGVVIVCYTLICWMKTPDRTAMGVLTLGLIGFFSYVRSNVLILYFAVFGLILYVYGPKLWQGVKKFLLSNIGFLGVILPWMIYAYIKYGYLTLWNKFEYVIKNRLTEIQNLSPPAAEKLARISIGSGSLAPGWSDFWQGIHLQAAHFMNSLIKSILIFPTSFRLEAIRDVLVEPYWDERVTWDGTVGWLFFVNLVVILLGIAFLVSRKKAIGAAPLVIGLMYNLASAMATTSGGRYLKPSIWIFILYYLAGLYFLLDKLLLSTLLKPLPSDREGEKTKAPPQNVRAWRSWIPAAVLIGVSAAVPLADALIPRNIPEPSQGEVFQMLPEEGIAALGVGLGDFQQLVNATDLTVYYGEGLYPRQMINDAYFGFSILGPFASYDSRFYAAPEKIDRFPPERMVVAVGCPKVMDNKPYEEMVLFYLPQENLLYTAGEDWMAYCNVELD